VLIANVLVTLLTSASNLVAKWKAKAWMMLALLNAWHHPMPLTTAINNKAAAQLPLHHLPTLPCLHPLP
jgi:hypothetical protein